MEKRVLNIDINRLVKFARQDEDGRSGPGFLNTTTGEILTAKALGLLGADPAQRRDLTPIQGLSKEFAFTVQLDWVKSNEAGAFGDREFLGQLEDALRSGPGAFGRFKALLNAPDRALWKSSFQRYRAQAARLAVIKWLAGIGIEPSED